MAALKNKAHEEPLDLLEDVILPILMAPFEALPGREWPGGPLAIAKLVNRTLDCPAAPVEYEGKMGVL